MGCFASNKTRPCSNIATVAQEVERIVQWPKGWRFKSSSIKVSLSKTLDPRLLPRVCGSLRSHCKALLGTIKVLYKCSPWPYSEKKCCYNRQVALKKSNIEKFCILYPIVIEVLLTFIIPWNLIFWRQNKSHKSTIESPLPEHAVFMASSKKI